MATKRKVKPLTSKDDQVDEAENVGRLSKEPEAQHIILSLTAIDLKRIGIRCVIVAVSFLCGSYFLWQDEVMDVFVGVSDTVTRQYKEVHCSADYTKERAMFGACVPTRCGRVVMDNVVSKSEAEHLLRTAKAGLSLGESYGGASILDLHSGALSKGDKFIDIYELIRRSGRDVFTPRDFKMYRQVKNKIHGAIAREFGIPVDKLYLTSPTFFSKMTPRPAQTIHDEYWHVHVDKETYGSFHYTSLLYLADYGVDFKGGRFVFLAPKRNITVEPKLGRVSFFTSGSENPHYVERVSSGIRYAITVSFTCDPKKAINDPNIKKLQ
ncbi:2-oxoglutarate and iron-dependent oxygenase domain-containing protein 3 [Lamellibrachia satsuma]|nr:2-oxoglutarate and iron-dependent oxygenase domain-containing protein 3 [Lamellibrachia satsuma]